MTLPRTEVQAGVLAELEAFEDLIRSIDDAEAATPTRCEGWRVADVAAHVIGSFTDITSGRLEGQGTPEVTARQVEERRGMTTAALAEELTGTRKLAADLLAVFDDAAWAAPSPGGYDFTLGQGVEALWYDVYLHGDDIRAALGRPSVGGDGLKVSASHLADVLTTQNWGPATLALDGLPRFDVSGGGGRTITGDPLAFILAAAGRGDPVPLGLDETVNVYRA